MENIRDDIEKIGYKLDKKLFKLSDEDLDSVYGGFAETASLPTKGYEIECVNCHTTDASKFAKSVYYDKVQNTVEYKCNGCGASFVVKDGYAIPKSKWMELCAQHHYTYKN